MRDFAKSMVSYSLATSLFGMSQVANLLRPSQAVKAFDNVTHATEGEFGDIFKATFTVGDNLQRRLLDLGFSVFRMGGPLNPEDVTKTAASAPSPAAPGGTTGRNPQSTGWGPVPPPPSSNA